MSKDFQAFALAVHNQFARMSAHELFTTSLEGQEVWDAYLASFPPDTNPIYRVRTVHDGSYDRNVIRKIGNLIAFDGDKPMTIWDVEIAHPYNEVCAVLAAKVKQATLTGIFRTKEKKFGYVSTTETLETGAVHRWYHFHADVATKHQARDPGAIIGEFNDKLGVYKRALEELSLDSFDTVLELINAGSLYRGDEHKANITKLRDLKLRYSVHSSPNEMNRLLYRTFSGEHRAVTTLRNNLIGRLLQDLTKGDELEHAVRAYEKDAAPTNYRRTTALVTPRMIEDAQKTLDALGLESALERRFAVLSDVSVNNVLWVNNDVQGKMKGGIAGKIGDLPQRTELKGKGEEVGVGEFMSNILSTVTSMELLFSNSITSNLVSITAPVHDDAGRLFKWDNGFAWSYVGNITDSIKERVKAAGGNVDAKLRVSLAWTNTDDLDLHAAQSPDGHVCFSSKSGTVHTWGGPNGQILDVDMNAPGTRLTTTPVENLSWRNPKDGAYQIVVHQYNQRDRSDFGFQLQFSFNGEEKQFAYDKALRTNEQILCLRFALQHGKLVDFQVGDGLTGGNLSREKWGIKTETFVKVNTIMFSPNHWDENEVGNLHYFFMLDGCVNDEPTRGIYNEFLLPELDKHRKVFELLGEKTKCPPSPEQLSGVGFSSTKRESVTVRVTTATRGSKLYTINF